MGIEPTSLAWEAGILPMNYARINMIQYSIVFSTGQCFSLKNAGARKMRRTDSQRRFIRP